MINSRPKVKYRIIAEVTEVYDQATIRIMECIGDDLNVTPLNCLLPEGTNFVSHEVGIRQLLTARTDILDMILHHIAQALDENLKKWKKMDHLS